MISHQKHTFLFFCLVLLMLGLTQCRFVNYSLTGVNTEAKTIYVANFQNRAGNGPPSLGQDFTERLKEYYQRNSPLAIADKEGELEISGHVKTYQVLPIAPSGDSRAAQNRLTIAVELDFVNRKDEKKNFTQSFSFYSDFPQEQTLDQVESTKIDEIFEQIILDIFNKTVADW
jgi:hypothetical protein